MFSRKSWRDSNPDRLLLKPVQPEVTYSTGQFKNDWHFRATGIYLPNRSTGND
jgi:hypothetical protein